MRSKHSFSIRLVLSAYFLYFQHAIAATRLPVISDGPTVLRKDERSPLLWAEFGDISAVKISDGMNVGCYHLHFITMDHQSLFLPAYLYSQMLLFVNSGNGTLSWINVDKDEHELQQLKLETGDICTLQPQTVFYLQNNLANEPQDLEIYAIFSDSETGLRSQECGRVYTGVRDVVLRFDNKILQATFNVLEEVVKELRGRERQALIVQEHGLETNVSMSEVGSWFVRAFLKTQNYDVFALENKKKKKKEKKKKDKKKKEKKKTDKIEAYNIFNADHNTENSYGWIVTADNEQFDVLHNSKFSVSMVNLTEGSMMGPHWNPTSEEIMIVLHGQGMVQVVCPNIESESSECKNSRFKIEEGDVFVVPRYHLMTQMSFTNKSFVFMGFTTTSENKPPQYLAGEDSILQSLDKTMLADSFGVRNMTLVDEVLTAQKESIFLKCKSCAEDEERLMEEEAEKEREGGGGGRQRADIEGEIAAREELELRRRWRKAEEAATRRKKGDVNY